MSNNRLASIRANLRDFWRKVKPPVCPVDRIKSTCWDWAGSTDGYGYAFYSSIAARRVSAMCLTGRIPEGVSMSCENRICVNPYHIYRIVDYSLTTLKLMESAFILRTSENKIIAERLKISVSQVARIRRLFPLFVLRDDKQFIESLGNHCPMWPMWTDTSNLVEVIE